MSEKTLAGLGDNLREGNLNDNYYHLQQALVETDVRARILGLALFVCAQRIPICRISWLIRVRKGLLDVVRFYAGCFYSMFKMVFTKMRAFGFERARFFGGEIKIVN